MSWPRVVLLGDSITQYSFQELGWGSYIQNLLQRKCDVYNRGYSGYNTKMILSKLKFILNDDLMKVRGILYPQIDLNKVIFLLILKLSNELKYFMFNIVYA